MSPRYTAVPSIGGMWGFDRIHPDQGKIARSLTQEEAERCVAVLNGGDGVTDALRRIAEGNLGDEPWQANYDRIREIAAEALAMLAASSPAHPNKGGQS